MAETVIQKEGTLLNVRPADRLDTSTAPVFRAELLPHLEGVRDIVMDFENVEYISSAGLRVLLEIYQEMEDRGGSLKLIHVRKPVMALFRLVNFADIVSIE